MPTEFTAKIDLFLSLFEADSIDREDFYPYLKMLKSFDSEDIHILATLLGENNEEANADACNLKKRASKRIDKQCVVMDHDSSIEYLDYVKNISSMAAAPFEGSHISTCTSNYGVVQNIPVRLHGFRPKPVCKAEVVGKSDNGSYVIIEVIDDGQKSTAFVGVGCWEKANFKGEFKCEMVQNVIAAKATSQKERHER